MADPNPLAGKPLGESLVSNMNESLQWMSRMWGSAATAPLAGGPAPMPSGLPSMLVPTLDPKELDKRISDLRSVEQWLDMNRALLHTTIQTLEVQRNAILALQSMAMSAQAGPAAAPRSAGLPAAASPPSGEAGSRPQPLPFDPAQWWNALSEQFARVASAAAAQAGHAAAGPEQPPGQAPLQRGPDAPPPRSGPEAKQAAGASPSRKGPGQ